MSKPNRPPAGSQEWAFQAYRRVEQRNIIPIDFYPVDRHLTLELFDDSDALFQSGIRKIKRFNCQRNLSGKRCQTLLLTPVGIDHLRPQANEFPEIG